MTNEQTIVNDKTLRAVITNEQASRFHVYFGQWQSTGFGGHHVQLSTYNKPKNYATKARADKAAAAWLAA